MTGVAALTAIGAAVCTAVVAAGLAHAVWRGGARWLRDAAVLQRRNWAGRSVPVSGGVVVAAASLAALAVAAVVVPVVVPEATRWVRTSALPVLALVAGFGLVGLVDDLLGDDRAKGFRGHVRALAHGEVTTGMVKLAGGAAVAVVVAAATVPGQGVGRVGTVLVQAAVVALCANAANLFDRAPGRLGKVSVVTGVPLLVVALWPGAAAGAAGVAVAAAAPYGATWSMLWADQRERLMLGDAGANVVGAVTGWLLVTVLATSVGTVGLWIALGVVVAANVLSEFVSWSRIIDAVAPLRAFDRWGRLPAAGSGDVGTPVDSGSTGDDA